MPVALCAADGTTIALDTDRWHGEADAVEHALLATMADPVLDIGCGPGRIGASLATTGRVVLGIDPAPAAVAEARRRGAPVLMRSVFSPLPGEGRWASALLLDGNIGIGGHPHALLERVRRLLAPGGQVVAEVGEPGTRTATLRVRLHVGDRPPHGPWFAWGLLSADRFAECASRAGLTPTGIDRRGGRWFAKAVKP